MNTPAHLIIGVAAFGKANSRNVTLAALAGSFLPDASLYFMVIWNRWVRGMSEQEIFGEAYFSDYWQGVFSIDNSIILWVMALVLGLYFRRAMLIAFGGAGTLHLVLDFALHHDDGRAHFWPISDWIFESPVSYWDPHAFGGIVGPIEGILCLILLVVLWRRYVGVFPKIWLVLVGLLELVPVIVFPILFAGG